MFKALNNLCRQGRAMHVRSFLQGLLSIWRLVRCCKVLFIVIFGVAVKLTCDKMKQTNMLNLLSVELYIAVIL